MPLRRWLSTDGLIADLLSALTPVQTPLPDTGDLRRDLRAVAARVAATLATPTSCTMLPLITATTDPRLAEAATRYWSSLFDHTAHVIHRAQNRGEASTDIDPRDAVESLLAPIYLRTVITREPITEDFVDRLAARTTQMLQRRPEATGTVNQEPRDPLG